MRIGLLSDTHGFLDEAVFTYFSDCDELWHAGDFGSADVLESLRRFKPTRGVFGNVDGAEIRAEVPCDIEWECEGIRVYMTHVGGYPGNYDRTAKQKLKQLRSDLFICGHSHILKVARDPTDGLLSMNPGACGHSGWHQIRTLLRFEVHAGKIDKVEAIELGARGREKRSDAR